MPELSTKPDRTYRIPASYLAVGGDVGSGKRSGTKGTDWASKSGDMIGPATDRSGEPLSIKLAWHAASVISVKSGAVDPGGAGRGKVSERRDALRPVAAGCLP